MAAPNDVVVAGTKAFALALFAPLTERLGTRPRIAPEAAQALTLCAGSSGVLVVEYGAAWQASIQRLRQEAPGLRIVAALPRGEEGAALALAPLGVEAVPWDGQPGPVLLAVMRLLGEAAPPRPAPRPATTPPAGTPAQPAPPRLSPSAPPLARPVATTPPAGTPAQPPPPRSAAAPPAPPSPAAPLSDDLFAGLEEAPPAPAPPHLEDLPAEPALVAPPPYTGPSGSTDAARPSTDWPANAPSEDEAESALILCTRGKLRPDAPLAALAKQAVDGMSELERQVLGGAALPFDAQPIYRAAVLRLRVAVALSTVPPPPARVDEAAVQRLLSELDALLALVNPIAQAAPPEHQASLEAVRNALVREAVDFSEACHTAVVPEAAAPRRSAGARIISMAADAAERPETRRGIIVVLVLAALFAAAFHGYRWTVKERAIAALPSLPGAPERMMLLPSAPGTPKVLLPLRGPPDREQVEKFKAQQRLLGNVVTELEGGGLSVAPDLDASKKEKSTP